MGFSTVHATELEQHTNTRVDAVFVYIDSVEKLLERGYIVNTSEIIETSYDLSEVCV